MACTLNKGLVASMISRPRCYATKHHFIKCIYRYILCIYIYIPTTVYRLYGGTVRDFTVHMYNIYTVYMYVVHMVAYVSYTEIRKHNL